MGLLNALGLARAASMTALTERLRKCEARAEALARKLEEARSEARSWRQRAEEAQQRVKGAEKEAAKESQRLRKVRADVEKEVAREKQRTVDVATLDQRLDEAERDLTIARDHLMAIEVKLDILEGAAQVLDTRTRQLLAGR